LTKTLLLGYGNPDRQDDGVAWHILTLVAHRLGRAIPATPYEEFSDDGLDPEFLFVLQLDPEMAEIIAESDRVCFIDAHTGSVPEDVNLQAVDAHYQSSPFTHHMTPSTCLAICQQLYAHSPEAILVSVRGYRFGFTHDLSTETQNLAEQAVEHILAWLARSP
jgi:hydrogenase maturation protease